LFSRKPEIVDLAEDVLDILSDGRKNFTTAEWKRLLLRSVGLEPLSLSTVSGGRTTASKMMERGGRLMDIRSISCVYFSPTGSTETIVESIARGMNGESVRSINLTLRSQRGEHSLAFNKEIVILGTPVYYGRVPEEAASCFSAMSGQQIPVVLVVTYGNRAFDDALLELRDIAVGRNFVPIAAAAFLAEHSYSSEKHPIAHRRPDDSDLKRTLEFGAAVRAKLLGLKSVGQAGALTVPGQVPYKVPEKLILIKNLRATTPLSFTPETDMAVCISCGLCAQVCPTGAICADDVTKTDKLRCIICFACIKKCPAGARQMNMEQFHARIRELSKLCHERKEPSVFL
jgi:ferredoxin